MSNKVKLILIVLMLIILLFFEIFVRSKNKDRNVNEDKNLINSVLIPTVKNDGPMMTQEEIEEVENNGGFTENINFDPPED